MQNAQVTEYYRTIARQEMVKWLCLNRYQQADSCMYGPSGCTCVERMAQVVTNLVAAERERCAKIADAWLTDFGDKEPKYVSAQTWASDAVKDIAAAIRGNRA